MMAGRTSARGLAGCVVVRRLASMSKLGTWRKLNGEWGEGRHVWEFCGEGVEVHGCGCDEEWERDGMDGGQLGAGRQAVAGGQRAAA